MTTKMNVLYINDELATNDGSNYHALGILNNLQKQLGTDSVRSFPAPVDGSSQSVNHNSLRHRNSHKLLMQLIRIVRKTILSRTRCHSICSSLEADNWAPTHVIARSVIFDTTAIHVAKHFHAKLIYEVNAPLYYEQCIVNQLPFPGAVKRWERTILHKADLVYAVSNICRDMLTAQYSCPASKFVVIPNGYMGELYDSTSADAGTVRAEIRSKENLDSKFVITFIGSLKKWHGISFLCELAAHFVQNPLFHFLIIGDGSEHDTVVNYCRHHSNMTFIGKLDSRQMSRYLLASDLGIMPYEKNDKFYFSPLKMYDMIGAGLPFIGTAQGQIYDIATALLSDDFLIKELSVTNIYKQVTEIASDLEKYQGMRLALLQAREKVTWSHRVTQLLQALEQLP